MVGLAVVQVPPELEQQGRQLNTHAQQLQRHSQGARDALAYLRATDALLAEGQDFNQNWETWLSSNGYPFGPVAEQIATIDRLRAKLHVLINTESRTLDELNAGRPPLHAQEVARHSYIDAICSELQRLRPVDLGATLRAPPSGSAFVEDAASPGRAPQSDMEILSDWQ